MSVNELQRIPVAGDDDTVPVLLTAFFANSADNVICLPPLGGVDGNVHGGKHLLHKGHLLGQFLRHTVAIGLIALVAFMPEGGAMEIEGHAYRVRIFFLLHALQNVQEPVDGMGVESLPGCQRLHAEIGPVDDAVAIQNHEFHTFLHFAP